MTALPLNKISVGNRHRKNPGDIDSLARSIADIGLLHPIVVRPDGTLIAGERRLRAVPIEVAYQWMLTHQLDRLAKRFRLAAAELEEFAAERRGEAA